MISPTSPLLCLLAVFAPDDDAFSAAARALKLSKIELLALPNLGDILKYHVLSGEVKSTDLVEGMDAKTLNGQTVKITLAGGAKVNGASVTKVCLANLGKGALQVFSMLLG